MVPANFTGPWCAQIFSSIFFWVFSWGCFKMCLTFKSISWVKQTASVWVGLLELIKCLNRTKKPEREGMSVWLPGAETLVFSCLLTQPETPIFPECVVYRFLDWNYHSESRALGLIVEILHRFSWVSRLLNEDLGTC